MPRKTDTADRVLEIADELLSEGVRPTQQNVRERLGSGSISTINKALNEWWESLAARMKEQHARPDLPEPIIDGATRMWQQALTYAENALQARHREIERYYEEKYAGAERTERALEELRAQNSRLLAGSESQDAKRQEAQQRISALEGEVIRLTAINEALSRENKQQALLIERSEGGAGSIDTDQLIELKVSLKLSEERCRQQQKAIDKLSEENADLKLQLRHCEQDALAKRHALETVIAQQDVRYDQAIKELEACRRGAPDYR